MMRITEDRKGKLIETIWDLNARFQDGEDDALQLMFDAVTGFAEEAAADERDRLAGHFLPVKKRENYDPRGCQVILALIVCYLIALGALIMKVLT
jgi:hypothetical protein